MNLKIRLGASDGRPITDPADLFFGNGTEQVISGRRELVGASAPWRLSRGYRDKAQLDLIRQRTRSKESSGRLMLELIGCLPQSQTDAESNIARAGSWPE